MAPMPVRGLLANGPAGQMNFAALPWGVVLPPVPVAPPVPAAPVEPPRPAAPPADPLPPEPPPAQPCAAIASAAKPAASPKRSNFKQSELSPTVRPPSTRHPDVVSCGHDLAPFPFVGRDDDVPHGLLRLDGAGLAEIQESPGIVDLDDLAPGGVAV